MTLFPIGGEPDRTADHAFARLVTRWAHWYRRKLGSPMPDRERGRAIGTLRRLVKSHGYEVVYQAVDRWWHAGRGDYGVGIFGARLDGGDAALTRRNTRQYTRAESTGSVDHLVRRYDD